MDNQFSTLKYEDNFEITPRADWVKEKTVANDSFIKIIRYRYDIDVELENTNRITRFSMLYELWRETILPYGLGPHLSIPHISDEKLLQILDNCGLMETTHIINTENQNPELYIFLKHSFISRETRGIDFNFSNRTVVSFPERIHAQGLMEDYLTAKSLVLPRLQTVHTLRHGGSAKAAPILKKQKYTRLLLPYSTSGTYPPDRLISSIRPEHNGEFCIEQSLND